MLMAIIIWLLHAALFGCAARRVSEYRNLPDGFWWGFWLGVPGLLIVIFKTADAPENSLQAAGSVSAERWRCCKCGTCNSEGRLRCQTCGAACDMPDPVKICFSCGAKNRAANTNCFACGKPFE